MKENHEQVCNDETKCRLCQSRELANKIREAIFDTIEGVNTQVVVTAMHLLAADMTVYGHAGVEEHQYKRLIDAGIIEDAAESMLDTACEIIAEYLDETNPERNLS